MTDTLQNKNEQHMTAEQVDKQLKEEGFNVDLLKQRDFVHNNVVEHMLNVLETSNIKYTAKAAERTTTDEFSSEEMRDFDCMIAAGGDGTFLKLASQIKSPDVPLVGMNTDGKERCPLLLHHEYNDKYVSKSNSSIFFVLGLNYN